MEGDDETRENELIRRRFDEWTFKGVMFLVPIVATIAVWAFSLQTRIETVATRQDERGPKIAALEKQVETLEAVARDPAPRPEARIAIEALRAEHKRVEDRLERLEERFNNLHNFLLNAPPKLLPMRRGELPPFKPDAG